MWAVTALPNRNPGNVTAGREKSKVWKEGRGRSKVGGVEERKFEWKDSRREGDGTQVICRQAAGRCEEGGG